MRNKAKALGALFIIPALLASGCGNSGDSGQAQGGQASGSPGSSASATASSAPAEPVEIKLWVPWTTEGPMKAFNQIIEAFNQKYESENISATVEFTPDFQQKLTTSFAGNAGPDLFIHGVGAMPGFADVGQLEDLSARVETLSDKDDYLSSYLKLASFDGKVYGLPVAADYNVLIYRKDFFEEAGAKVPTTWKEFEEAAAKLVRKDGNKITRLAMDIPVGSGNRFILQQHYGFFLQNNGGDFLTGDYANSALNTAQAKETLEWFSSLYENDYVTVEGAGTPQGAQAVAAGTAAMQVGSLFQLMEIKLNQPEMLDKIGVAVPPAGPNGEGKAPVFFTGPQVVMINKASAHKEAAWKLADFLAAKDSLTLLAEQLGSIPLRSSMGTEAYDSVPVLKEYLSLGEQGTMVTNPLTPKWVAVRDVLVKYLEETVYKHNPENTIVKADEEINKLLAQ
mgnify:CR=1 FL=1